MIHIDAKTDELKLSSVDLTVMGAVQDFMDWVNRNEITSDELKYARIYEMGEDPSLVGEIKLGAKGTAMIYPCKKGLIWKILRYLKSLMN